VAAVRAPKEMGAKLVSYHVCVNIDLQPGHMGALGEIELWREFETWARATHDVAVELHDLNWVVTRVKQFPYLRPDLFEDVNEALQEVREHLAAKIDEVNKANTRMLQLVERLAEASGVEARLKTLLVRLAQEARAAFEVAQAHGRAEKFVEAITKLEDARRLLEMENVDERLRGHVLLLLCGVKALTGPLSAAVSDGEAALALLKDVGDADLLRLARGNIGMALYKLQRYDEAGPMFEAILAEYEADANLVEVVRTLEHLTEMRCNSGDLDLAFMWAGSSGTLRDANHRNGGQALVSKGVFDGSTPAASTLIPAT
jgi:tetratricopeptide (TPR) repeat protein